MPTPAKLHAGFVLNSKFCVYLLGRQILLIWLCETTKNKTKQKASALYVFENLVDFLPAQSLAKTVGKYLRKMKHLFYILIISSINVIGQQKPIYWKQNEKLTWEDFQGKADPKSSGNAKTTYKIDITPSNIIVDENDNIHNYKKLSTVAIFYKDLSWSKEKNKNSLLLKHEQLHFDIAELYARKIKIKFREAINRKETKFSVYQKIYSDLWNECRLYQKKYDKETIHGLVKTINEKWIQKVNEELSLLNIPN
ncbi:hypothetical protein QVZ41_14440 [Wenyingzhuangia sp. chi5]|uniref:DUF922 domain-containing protein n=1 Tax=Wenyingzhuangia gilva TaxID=3057677 RepID=A0ABT8VVP4_9FLAO|nr:hypothetical protein [Wenyingzhuangia sp. chi5]MDO3696048.1 hypothetical protein [Wenyingzhuangia sp. chi5]